MGLNIADSWPSFNCISRLAREGVSDQAKWRDPSILFAAITERISISAHSRRAVCLDLNGADTSDSRMSPSA